MPGPDYPWATYITGAKWADRPSPTRIDAVLLHAVSLRSAEDLIALRERGDTAYHYAVTETGAVVQMAPERGWCRAVGKTTRPCYSDKRVIHIAIDGAPDQAEWPDDQVLAVARIVGVIWAVRGRLPVRDAGNVARPQGRIPEITAWPWLHMHQLIPRLETPIDIIYRNMTPQSDGEYPEPEGAFAPYLDCGV